MPLRNTEGRKEIPQRLEIERPHALARLENHFQSLLLIVAGNENDVAQYAERLRLAIIETERGAVLDYIQQKGLSKITIGKVEGRSTLYSRIDKRLAFQFIWDAFFKLA